MRPQAERGKGNNPDNILREEYPKCDCSGFTATTTKLSKALGLICEHAGGTSRAYGDKVYEKDLHGWVVYNIEGRLIPSDATGDQDGYLEAGCYKKLMGKIRGNNVLPLRRLEWETFFASHFTHYYGQHNYRWLKVEPFIDLEWDVWKDMESTHAKQLVQELMDVDLKRNRRLAKA